MGKGDKEPRFFRDIENRDSIFTRRLHTEFKTVVFCKPVSQFLKPFGKRRETSLLILSSAVCVGNPDAGIDPCFVDIKPTTVFTKDFKSQENNLLRFIVASWQGLAIQQNRVGFGGDKFTGYRNAPFIDILMDDRQSITVWVAAIQPHHSSPRVL